MNTDKRNALRIIRIPEGERKKGKRTNGRDNSREHPYSQRGGCTNPRGPKKTAKQNRLTQYNTETIFIVL